MIPLPRHQVHLSAPVLAALGAALAQRQVLHGPHVAELERRWADATEVPFALGTSSGRIAFLLALRALDLQPGDQVAVPDYTLAAVPALLVAMGLEPLFVDVDPLTHHLDVDALERALTPRIRAVLATHLFGLCSDVARLEALCAERDLWLLEDCAQSAGTLLHGRPLGSFGHLAFFSFNTGKNVASFGGGLLVGKAGALWERVRREATALVPPRREKVLSTVARVLVTWGITSRAGFPLSLYPALRLADGLGSDRIDRAMVEAVVPPSLPDRLEGLADLQARVGLVQLDRLPAVNARTRRHGEILAEALEGLPGVRVPRPLPGCDPSRFYLKVEVPDRDALRPRLLRRGIDTNADDMFACSELDIFAPWARPCPVASAVHARSLEVPNGFALSERDVRRVAGVLREELSHPDSPPRSSAR
ncbi:MAG: aminotransferase class I/II-fold pyridoxal phosphate-dependent enzyme [Pseudomonadota bacterium]